MKTIIVSALAAVLLLGACASPEHAAKNRSAHMAKLLPNPADRNGIFLIFPLKRSLLVTYFPSQVSEAQIMQRVQRFCPLPVHSSKPTKAKQVKMADGSSVPANNFVIDCRGK